jgi:hypothetical protein
MQSSLHADAKKLTFDQRVALMRGLVAEYAKVKTALPRSKKPLEIDTKGNYDKQKWGDSYKEFGPCARVGDLVQVTKIDIEKDRILFEINGGMKSKGSWKDHVSIGMGGGTRPISQNQTDAPAGTNIVLEFGEPIGEVTAAEVKKLLAPILDFEKQSATENYADTIPPEIKKAIEDKKPIEGMDRDQVLMALGRPTHKSRETKDGIDYEDWIYGTPPGRVTFVTFSGPKVVKVKETYAGLGGSVAETKQIQ